MSNLSIVSNGVVQTTCSHGLGDVSWPSRGRYSRHICSFFAIRCNNKSCQGPRIWPDISFRFSQADTARLSCSSWTIKYLFPRNHAPFIQLKYKRRACVSSWAPRINGPRIDICNTFSRKRTFSEEICRTASWDQPSELRILICIFAIWELVELWSRSSLIPAESRIQLRESTTSYKSKRQA